VFLISERVISYGRAVDLQRLVLFGECFTDPCTGLLQNGLPAADFARHELVEIVRSAVSGYTATQHLSANHATSSTRTTRPGDLLISNARSALLHRRRRAAHPARLGLNHMPCRR
jgi:hypothetical protein